MDAIRIRRPLDPTRMRSNGAITVLSAYPQSQNLAPISVPSARPGILDAFKLQIPRQSCAALKPLNLNSSAVQGRRRDD
jgi:hypothetical protein